MNQHRDIDCFFWDDRARRLAVDRSGKAKPGEPRCGDVNQCGLSHKRPIRPWFAHGITKTQLNQEWSMSLDQAIEAEAQAQAICMQTRDFERAYNAFVAKQTPVFEGD